MSASLASQIMEAIPNVQSQYYKLVLAVGPARCGKTTALQRVSEAGGWPKININLRLSERMLELTKKQRKIYFANTLDEIINSDKSPTTILDNIEIMFGMELEQDPLRLLQRLSRNKTIVAAWPGIAQGNCLIYAEPGHPEARRYDSPEACIVAAHTPGMMDFAVIGKASA